jgi:hypothetical protein
MDPNKLDWTVKPPLGGRQLVVLGALAGVLVTSTGFAQDTKQEKKEETPSTPGSDPVIELDPATPQVGALAGGMTPAFGTRVAGDQSWRFDFHGIIIAPLRVGLNKREHPAGGQSKTVLHAPPMVPDDIDSFSHTGVVPTPYVQLNLTYGSDTISGTVTVLARQPVVASGFFDPPSQAGINDAFLRYMPDLGKVVRVQAFLGAFTNRYGITGEYDEGRYGTPLIARLHGAGENVQATFRLGDFRLLVEQGILGTSNKAGVGMTPDGWNDFADPSVGTSFVNHWHFGLGYKGLVTLGGHYIGAWSQDDTATGTRLKDGTIGVLGGDLRFTLGHLGHLYLAASHTNADHARTVGRVIEVLNTRGGRGLMDNYLGANSDDGTGQLMTFGAQYDLSLGRLLSYPIKFTPDGPDAVVSLFGMQTYVKSHDPRYQGITKRKYGAEATYGFLSWLSASLRYDRVDPNIDNQRYSFAVISPRLIFHTDWNSTDQVVLQYSHWMNGSLTTIRTGYPPRDDVTAIPDEDMISLSANMWW